MDSSCVCSGDQNRFVLVFLGLVGHEQKEIADGQFLCMQW
jgi:hypothetical protein